jgi:halogenation protein CepH
MTTSDAFDAIVIGGGPAGSTAAAALVDKGRRVLLLEREHFPREHIGESLLPATMPFLEWLGVMPAVQEAGFLKKWGATMLWGSSREPWSWYFRETNTAHPHAFQVWRARFDQILLDNARSHGADVREGHRVTSVLFDGDRAVGVRFVEPGGHLAEARAPWTIDASGQAALIGRARGLRQWDTHFQNMAVYGYFEGAERLPDPDQTNIFIESYAGGWFWNIPLHNGWMSSGAVIDSRRGQDLLRTFAPLQLLQSEIAAAPGTSRMLRDARLAHGPFTLKDWSYLSLEVAGDGYVLAGDAACFIDPLFSSGVHLAMMSGAMAAAYVTTALKDESMRLPGARFYREQYLAEYNQFREMAKLFYATNRSIDSFFWEARRILGPDAGGDSARQSFIRAVAGRPPRGYERVVIERGEMPTDLVREIRAAEAGETARRDWFDRRLADEGRERLLASAPVMAGGARLQKQPEIVDGEFAWGFALSRGGEMLGRPLDAFTARAASLMDGHRSLLVIADAVAPVFGAPRSSVEEAVIRAVRALFIAGDVELSLPA